MFLLSRNMDFMPKGVKSFFHVVQEGHLVDFKILNVGKLQNLLPKTGKGFRYTFT